MPRKPQPPQRSGRESTKLTAAPPPTSWTIYKLAARQQRLGTVEAATESEAIEEAAAEFKQYAPKLMACRPA